MKILLTLILLISFEVCESQNQIKEVLYCAKNQSEYLIKKAVGKKIFESNFKFIKRETIIEIYNLDLDKLERVSLAEFENYKIPATQFWLIYKIKSQNLILTTLRIPFNLNCTTPWNSDETSEIIKPYLKVLTNKIRIDLKQVIKIAKSHGLSEINKWNIDYEKRKLVWTLKGKIENNQSKVIKINSKNGKILAEFTEIQID